MSKPKEGLVGPGCKLMLGLVIGRCSDAYFQYHPSLLPRGVFDEPMVWYASMGLIMVGVYALTPKKSGLDQQTLGSDIMCLAMVEAFVQATHMFCRWRGDELVVPAALWRSWFVLDALALGLSTVFIQRADKEVAHGSRP